MNDKGRCGGAGRRCLVLYRPARSGETPNERIPPASGTFQVEGRKKKRIISPYGQKWENEKTHFMFLIAGHWQENHRRGALLSPVLLGYPHREGKKKSRGRGKKKVVKMKERWPCLDPKRDKDWLDNNFFFSLWFCFTFHNGRTKGKKTFRFCQVIWIPAEFWRDFSKKKKKIINFFFQGKIRQLNRKIISIHIAQ